MDVEDPGSVHFGQWASGCEAHDAFGWDSGPRPINTNGVEHDMQDLLAVT